MANEKRLIDANELVKVLDNLKSNLYRYEDYNTGVDSAVYKVENAPTVDAVEVVHGRWEWIPTDECISVLTCSVCKNTEGASIFNNYCPNCGAKMDGDGND